jgi:hypothetical protein
VTDRPKPLAPPNKDLPTQFVRENHEHDFQHTRLSDGRERVTCRVARCPFTDILPARLHVPAENEAEKEDGAEEEEMGWTTRLRVRLGWPR